MYQKYHIISFQLPIAVATIFTIAVLVLSVQTSSAAQQLLGASLLYSDFGIGSAVLTLATIPIMSARHFSLSFGYVALAHIWSLGYFATAQDASLILPSSMKLSG